MANKYYRANNGLDQTSSWSDTASGATGATVPADGDDVFFLELEGELSVGLTQFETGTPATITVGKNCRLTTAAGSAGIEVGDASNTCTDIRYEGSGANFAITASNANAIDNIHVNCSGTLTVTKNSSATAIDNVYVSRAAKVNVRGALKPNVYAFGGEVDVRGGGTVATLDSNAGRVYCEDTVTTLNLAGSARVTIGDDASVTTANANGGTLNLRSSGTTTTLNQKGGTVTPAGSDGTHTLTTANLYGTSATTNFVESVGLSSFTVGTTNKFGTVSKKSTDDGGGFGPGA